MNMAFVIGGALVNTSVTPINESTVHDARTAVALAAFLSMLEKSHNAGKSDEFLEIEKIFLSEVDNYLDDQLVSQSADSGASKRGS